jgi:purine-binding chemotaxis protein CheW
MTQIVVFVVAGEAYGIPITQVQEIIRYSPPRTIPSSPPSVGGVINLRSKIIPVCDFAASLGLGPGLDADPSDEERQTVIIETAFGTVGLVVDGVESVLTIADGDVSSSLAADAPYILGIVEAEDRLLVLLDPDALMEAFGLATGGAIAA